MAQGGSVEPSFEKHFGIYLGGRSKEGRGGYSVPVPILNTYQLSPRYKGGTLIFSILQIWTLRQRGILKLLQANQPIRSSTRGTSLVVW